LSAVLVAGVAQLELALRWEDEEQYQKAFLLTAEATRRLCLASFWSYDPLHRHSLPRAFEYLPHSWDELDPEDAVRIFNKLRSDPDRVRGGWAGVRNACKYFEDLYQYDWSVPSVTDDGGERLPPERYWERAAAFAEEQMSTHELRRALREGEAERAEERLRRDFLYDIWADLGLEAQNRLVEAEKRWVEKGNLKYKDMMDAYRLALEAILADVFPDLADRARQEIAQRKKTGERPMLLLTAIKRLLERGDSQKELAGNLGTEGQFVQTDLPQLLDEILKTRNVHSHANELLTPMTEEDMRAMFARANEVRRKLLGIRHERAAIQRLVEIKKAMKQGTEHSQSG
jgi:hypothetical protein